MRLYDSHIHCYVNTTPITSYYVVGGMWENYRHMQIPKQNSLMMIC